MSDKKKEDEGEAKKAEQREFQTLTNSYLMTEQSKLNGVLPRLYNYTDYNTFSKPTDDIDIATGMPVASVSSIPNPIVGSRILLPDGTVFNPALSWAALADNDSGRYRISVNNFGESVNGDLIYDWNLSRLRLDSGVSLDITDMTSGSVLFAGTSGRISQDNAKLFWDDTSNRLGVGTNTPQGPVDFFAASGETVRMSSSVAAFTSFASSAGTLYVASTAWTYIFGDFDDSTGNTVSLTVFNSSTSSDSSRGLIQAKVGGNSAGDPFFRCNIDDTTFWSFGLDNSDSDTFKWSFSSTLGTSDRLTLTTTGFLTLPLSNALTTPGFDVTQASTGDAAIRWTLGSAISYAVGIDNSIAGDPFVISTAASASAALGTGNILSITSGGLATWSRSDAVTTPTEDYIQSSTGDSCVRFAIGTTNSWAIGADNSDSDKFKVSWLGSGSAALGTNDYMSITVAGLVGVGTASPTNLFTVGNAGVTGTDAGINVTRTVADPITGDSRAVADNSVITRTDTNLGYDTFDANAVFTGTANRRVWDALFSRGTWNSSGTLTNYYGVAHFPVVMQGTVTNMYGFRANDYSNGGAVTTYYGIYIDSLTKAGTNWAIYTNGATQSYFGGKVGMGTLTPRKPLDVLDIAGAQIRATYTDNSVYTDLFTGSDGTFNITPTGNYIYLSKNSTDSIMGFEVINSNTSTGGANYFAAAHPSSTGDPFIRFDITGTLSWAIGVDNSDSDKFKISASSVLGFGSSDCLTITTGGVVNIPGELDLDGALNHDGTTVGFYGVTPVVRSSAYTPTNVTTDRAYDADSTSTAELADVLGTLIADLKATGIIA